MLHVDVIKDNITYFPYLSPKEVPKNYPAS
jgi:hypothetical protein